MNQVRISELVIGDSQEYCVELNDILPKEYDEFRNNRLIYLSSERLFEIIVQIILDICSYITSQLPVKSPKTYAGCIEILVEKDILKKQDKTRYVNLAKMRNLIVHRYGDVDLEILFEALDILCDDFGHFSDQILNWIKM